jgi:23S rRNA pseudouridine1911/1915/1917 synthase
VRKVYWAVVETAPCPAEGILRDWLKKVPDEARTEVVPAGTPDARECVLNYRTLAGAGKQALVEIELITGRMHQIRMQFSSRGWCIVGDTSYGASTAMEVVQASAARENPIALHARQLTFLHPIRYEPVTVVAPVPVAWRFPFLI